MLFLKLNLIYISESQCLSGKQLRKLAPLLPLHHNPPDGLLCCNSVYFICALFENIYKQQNGFEQRSKVLYNFVFPLIFSCGDMTIVRCPKTTHKLIMTNKTNMITGVKQKSRTKERSKKCVKKQTLA